MVKSRKKRNRKSRINQGRNRRPREARKIRPSTPYGYTDELLTPYGGLLPLIKLLDGLKFHDLFNQMYREPARKTLNGSYFFIKGIVPAIVLPVADADVDTVNVS